MLKDTQSGVIQDRTPDHSIHHESAAFPMASLVILIKCVLLLVDDLLIHNLYFIYYVCRSRYLKCFK